MEGGGAGVFIPTSNENFTAEFTLHLRKGSIPTVAFSTETLLIM